MNTNEVIANRFIELAGGVLGSKSPSTPTTMLTGLNPPTTPFPPPCTSLRLRRSPTACCPASSPSSSLHAKAVEWESIVKIGRTHLMDAVPLTWPGSVRLGCPTGRRLRRLDFALDDPFELALGGTAVGTGLNAHPPAQMVADEIANITGLTFCSVRTNSLNWPPMTPSSPPRVH